MTSFEKAAEYIKKNDLISLEKLLEDDLSRQSLLDEYSSSLLYLAVEEDSPGSVRLLLESGVDPNSRIDNDRTLLHIATGLNNREIVRIVLDYAANVNLKDSYGQTALHYAAGLSTTEIVKLLLDSGVDVNIRNRVYRTALHITTISYNIDIVKLLILYGSDPYMRDRDGRTPLDYLDDSRLSDKLLFIYRNRSKILEEIDRLREIEYK